MEESKLNEDELKYLQKFVKDFVDREKNNMSITVEWGREEVEKDSEERFMEEVLKK